jgi:hypothetical protein
MTSKAFIFSDGMNDDNSSETSTTKQLLKVYLYNSLVFQRGPLPFYGPSNCSSLDVINWLVILCQRSALYIVRGK